MTLNRRRKLLAAVGIVAIAGFGTTAMAAFVLPVLVDNAVTVNHGTFKSEHGLIKLKTKGPVRIRDVQTTGAPGFIANWHTHPGPVIVAMSDTSPGSLTIYQARRHGDDEDGDDGGGSGCTKHVLSAGQAYIEIPNTPVFARNESSGNAEWVTTMILPIGVPPATPFVGTPPCTIAPLP